MNVGYLLFISENLKKLNQKMDYHLTDLEENFDDSINDDDSFELDNDKDEDPDDSLFDKESDNENDIKSEKYVPLDEKHSLDMLEAENTYEPYDKEDSLEDTGLEENRDLPDAEEKNDYENYSNILLKEKENFREIEERREKIEEEKPKEEDDKKSKRDKMKNKENKNDKPKRGKRGKRGKKGRRGKSAKSSGLRGVKKDIKEIKKKLLNKDILMKSDEELAREIMNKKYRRHKNIEDVYYRS